MNPLRAADLRRLLAAILLSAAVLPALALAKTSDRDQPMTLDADASVCNQADANSRCVFNGNVVIVQGTLEIRADRAEIVRSNGDIAQAGRIVQVHRRAEAVFAGVTVAGVVGIDAAGDALPGHDIDDQVGCAH